MTITNLTFLLYFTLFFMIILMTVYLSKQRIKNEENKIYKVLLISNIIGIILQIILEIITCFYNDLNFYFCDFLYKIYMIYFIVWLNYLLLYLIEISFTKKKSIIKLTKIFIIIESIITFFMTYNVHRNQAKGIYYIDGPIVNYVYIITIGIVFIMCLISALKWKTNDKKKIAPIILFVLSGFFVSLIQMSNPSITVSAVVESLICFLMYFTIENPDVKMIKQLEIAKTQADKANRAKTEFLSSMSHEIRTPLNAIVGFSDYILTSDTLEEAKENATDIVNASNTLLEIVNGILDISKIEAGKLEIVNSKYSARNTFESLAKLITPKMQEKGLDFTYYIAPDIPETLFGDHANIKKIVTNLLSNAYKYTEKGFVRYEVNCINSDQFTKLIITVEDSGRGIKQESIDKLFTKFQRLDEDRNTTIEGTGLGLAITKQLIELMGGKILVHTVYGEGSKFTVVLNQRIELTPIDQKPEQPIKTTLDLKDKKILLIDDNALNIKVATKTLERYNANCITAFDNGFDCIKDIQNGSKYDIILMDDMMPKMTGVETFKKLKEIPGFNMPVVILTANAITGMKEKYMSEGFDDYLAKPIEKDELIRVCNTILYQDKPSSKDEEIEELEPTEQLEIIEEEPIKQEPIPASNNPENFLRNNNVDLDKALEFLGDMEMYNMTVGDFLTEVEEKWNRIKNYKETNDMPNYAIEVHSLKSDAKYLGLMFLADVAYQHELKSKANDNAYVQANFNELQTVYDKALNIIKQYNEMIK